MAEQTPSQTVGPYFAIGLIHGGENEIVEDQTRGERILIQGSICDGNGQPIPDAVIETWQADWQGIFNHPSDPRHEQADPHFFGFARAPTDDDGRYWVRTIKPGAVDAGNGEVLAPCINIRVFMRGLLIQAHTRLYFSDEEAANANDPVLSAVDPERRHTLLAKLLNTPGQCTYEFNIQMQGQDETVFFNP